MVITRPEYQLPRLTYFNAFHYEDAVVQFNYKCWLLDVKEVRHGQDSRRADEGYTR